MAEKKYALLVDSPVLTSSGGWRSAVPLDVRTALLALLSVVSTMQLFVRTDETHTVELCANDTVQDVKAVIEARQGIPAAEQRVMFGGRQLHEEASLASEGVSDESTMYILMRLLGGAKKRKKKTYTKPKKQKHKHKKIKLAVLKFYKVDDSGKVQRLRKTCPAPECGPGIFMATHFNRVYCGKCGLTYTYDKEQAKA
ncbi:Ubiquitin-40S ribosomal protein S27a [Trebouxia sp. C0010 RCD-2024]